MGFFHRIGQKISNTIQSVGSKMSGVANAIGNKVGGGIIKGVQSIESNSLGNFINEATGLGNLAQGVGTGIGGVITAGTGLLTGNLGELIRGDKQMAVGGVEALTRSQEMGDATRELLGGNIKGAISKAADFGVKKAETKVLGKPQKALRGKMGLSRIDDVIRTKVGSKLGAKGFSGIARKRLVGGVNINYAGDT